MMNEIRQMIENGESETVEFKENFDKEAVETAVAYLLNLGLNERQTKAVRYVKEKGKITNKEYYTINNISRQMATIDLANLVEKGIFMRTGKAGKGIAYQLPELTNE